MPLSPLLQQLRNQAIAAHEAGDLRRAAVLYHKILADSPQDSDALHLLGVLNYQAGRKERGLNLIRQALQARPDFPEALCHLGNALQDAGEFEEAIASYRKAIALQPNSPDTQHNLANALARIGHIDQAIVCYQTAIAQQRDHSQAYKGLATALHLRKQSAEAISCLRAAIHLKPDDLEAYLGLAALLKQQGERDGAIRCYQDAIARTAGSASLYFDLGAALKERGDLEEAIACYRKAIELQPDYADAHNNLGNAVLHSGAVDEAAACYRRAIELNPRLHQAHHNLGRILREQGRLEEALARCRAAIAIEPAYALGHCNLGIVFREQMRLDEAIGCYRAAIALDPDLADAHKNLANVLLLSGQFEEAWSHHDWRWKSPNFEPQRPFTQPHWDGAALPEGTILLTTEQGLGDAIQFVRYAEEVARRCGRVVLECRDELVALMRSMPDVQQVVRRGDSLPHFDVQCSLMSLPGIFNTTEPSIPRKTPYLFADPQKAAHWAERLEREKRPRIGLAWAGSRLHANDRDRSIALPAFARLIAQSDAAFISLQKPFPVGADVQGLRLPAAVGELADFSDTAALIANLDLVISVDTAVAHVAGALGKPVWTLLPFSPDWRWLTDRSDSPWYPTMRLFRQPSPGDWDSVMTDVARALTR